MILDASEKYAFDFALSQGFEPRKDGPNAYAATRKDDPDVLLQAATPGQFVREVAAASSRMKRGDKR